jgi:aerobic-type carbon monoxide dehydrogenase small subunit (CoxS/CutS family)
LTINREQKSFDAPADMPLLWVLRDVLGMSQSADECEARKIPAQCYTMTGLVF